MWPLLKPLNQSQILPQGQITLRKYCRVQPFVGPEMSNILTSDGLKYDDNFIHDIII